MDRFKRDAGEVPEFKRGCEGVSPQAGSALIERMTANPSGVNLIAPDLPAHNPHFDKA